PDDDAHRLVYADWLDDHGDAADQARAALIRCQCEAERLPAGNKRRSALEKQAAAIIRAHPEWTSAILKGKLASTPEFSRGFLHRVTLSATQFMAVEERLFAAAPTLRAARITDASNDVINLARCPSLARLTEIDLSRLCWCGLCPIHFDLRATFASPWL